MSDLTDALERILIYLEEHESLEYARFESLQEGLTREEIDDLTAGLPFRLPVEVYELYQWGNGAWVDEEWHGQYFMGEIFLPLETAVAIYEAITQPLSKEDYEQYYYFSSGYSGLIDLNWADELINSIDEGTFAWARIVWHPRLFPIFWSYDTVKGCHAVVVDSVQQDTSPIISVDFVGGKYDEYPIIYSNLTKMVQAEAECYKAGLRQKPKDQHEPSEIWGKVSEIHRKYQDYPQKWWLVPDF